MMSFKLKVILSINLFSCVISLSVVSRYFAYFSMQLGGIKTMDNYTKGKNVEEPFDRDKIPIDGLPVNFLWMQVKGGSKMTHLLSHAINEFKNESRTAVLWSGAGAAIPKAVSCAESFKKQLSIEHQVSRLTVTTVEEYWEPKIEGLETLVVIREIPVIHILLSMFKIKDSASGYQNKQIVTFLIPNKPGRPINKNTLENEGNKKNVEKKKFFKGNKYHF